jgi:phospholipid-binding lipoprotein MlaA
LLLSVAASAILTGCGSVSGLLKSDGVGDMPVASAQAPPPAETDAVSVTEPEPTGSAEVTSPAAVPLISMPPAPIPEDSSPPALDPSGTALTRIPDADDRPVELRVDDDDNDVGSALAQGSDAPLDEDYDPWEPFNEKMFTFNRNLDRFVLKPAARAYRFVMPEPWQVLIANGFDNINFVPRMVNSLLQAKWGGAGRELGRFLINSTAGIGGLFDPAKDYWGIQKSREDFGQTLCTWGAGPGPYLIVPLMEPLTVRDGIGKAVDGFMDPLSYVLPFFWDRLGMKAGDILNDRALNYDLFQGFEESVIDLYSAVRHGYLQRRQALCKE